MFASRYVQLNLGDIYPKSLYTLVQNIFLQTKSMAMFKTVVNRVTNVPCDQQSLRSKVRISTTLFMYLFIIN